jgi:DNA-binding NarL/FixJ family response regulator
MESTMTPTSSTRSAPSPRHSQPHNRNPAPIRVLIVDDHPAVRLGSSALIDDQPDMHVAAQAGSVGEALSLLDTSIDVAVIDYHLRGGRDGLALVAHIGERQLPARTLVYSAFADGALAALAVIAGADGMLGKHELGDELCNAIRRVARGQHHLPAVAAATGDAMRTRLEPVDQAIFGMLLHGVAPATIAERLSMTAQQLAIRRAGMLRALKPSRAQPLWPEQGTSPLDYERPKRRLSLSGHGDARIDDAAKKVRMSTARHS